MKNLSRFVVTLLLLFASAAAAADRPVLVFGATGRLGAAIVKALPADIGPVTAFARHGSDRTLLAGTAVNYVEGDALSAADVARAIQTVKPEIVINAMAKGNFQGPFYETTQEYITAAAKAHGVKQIIFVGALGAGDSRPVYPERRWKMFGPAITDKDNAEKAIMASGVGYTIIRNDQIVSDSVPATGKAQLTEDQRAMGAITRADLGALIAGCAGAPRCMNKIYHGVDTIPFVPSTPRP